MAKAAYDRYQQLLAAYLQVPDEAALLEAADLGRALLQDGVPPEEIAEIHHLALTALGEQQPALPLASTAQATALPLIEALMVYGIAFREQVAERERRSRANLEAVTEQSQDLIVITDKQGRVEYVNPAFLATTGYTNAECLGSTPAQLVKSGRQAATVYQELWRTIQAGQAWQGRLIDRAKQGKLFVIDTSIFPLRDHAGAIMQYVAIARDITERVAMERTVQEKNQRLEGVATLAAGIAHDANNLLGMVLGYTDLLADSIADELSQANLEQIKLAATRSRDLIAQVLDFARRDQTAGEVEVVPVIDVINEVASLLKVSCPPTLHLTISETAPGATVRIRRSQLTQVLMNLALNAEQAMGLDGGQLVIEVHWQSLPPETLGLPAIEAGYVAIRVSDTGPGIPEELQFRVFDPLFTTKNEAEGTGLGLSVAKNIIEAHHGGIELWSEVGKGARFTVILPHQSGAKTQPAAASPTVAPPADHRLALVVDDEPSQLVLIKHMAKRAGVEILVTDNPLVALKAFHQEPARFFAVVTDHYMPEIDGTRMAQHMLEVNPELYVALCSGSPEDIDVEGVKALGINAFLAKPIDYGQLMENLKAYRDQGTGV